MRKRNNIVLAMAITAVVGLSSACSVLEAASGAAETTVAQMEMQGTVETKETETMEAETFEVFISEQKTMTGTIEEIKDFMFTIVAADGNAYAFSFDEYTPDGLADVKNGDEVTVTYTGEVSLVDPFNGTILSVSPAGQ